MDAILGKYTILNKWTEKAEEKRKQMINQIIRKLCIAELEKKSHFYYNKDVAWTGDASDPEKKEVSNSC